MSDTHMKYNLPTEYDRRIPKSEDDEPENGITIKSCLYASISINNFFMYMYVGDTEESKPIDIEKGRRNLQEVRYYKRWSLSVTITQHNLDPNINQQTQTEQGEQL